MLSCLVHCGAFGYICDEFRSCFLVCYLCFHSTSQKKFLLTSQIALVRELVSQLTTQFLGVWFFLVVVVLCGWVGAYWVISCFWGSCTVASMFGGCFWVLVCWFPIQRRLHPIVQRMRIRGRRRRMSVRLRIWVQPVMVGCARVGVIAFMNFGYELVLRLG